MNPFNCALAFSLGQKVSATLLPHRDVRTFGSNIAFVHGHVNYFQV